MRGSVLTAVPSWIRRFSPTVPGAPRWSYNSRLLRQARNTIRSTPDPATPGRTSCTVAGQEVRLGPRVLTPLLLVHSLNR